ncbi:MAG: YlmC/YmxH family sporulation protein [Oscillospiraceae bacterium]|nr:YlmC/YmxH family sporulation protein [Oscillospiraceae bacterium]
MRVCSFEELSKKEVISCMDCTRLGFIVDINIQLENALIVSVVVELPCSFFSIRKNTVVIPWECIKKIGDDLIIADYILPPALPSPEHKHSFFSRLFKS